MSALLLLLLLAACSADDQPNAEIVASGDVFVITVGEDTVASLPERGPDVDPAEAELGWLLFWDPVLSGAGDVACATCHLPEHGYADGLRTSVGIGGVGRGPDRSPHPGGLVARNAPGIVNAVFNGIENDGSYAPNAAPMFWDNRASGLAAQAREPVMSEPEMRGDTLSEGEIWDEVASRVEAIEEYRMRFDAVYGEPISVDTITRAIAAFESTLVANNAPFDRWMRGDLTALSEAQFSGLVAFFEADCVSCHSGPMFSDFETHVLAAPDGLSATSVDTGDGEHAFRTPTLRQLAYTAPYFHGGHAATIEASIEFYNLFVDGNEGEGMNMLNPGVPVELFDEELADVDLEEGQIAAIAAFLESLNDPEFFVDEPPRVPSGLPVGGFE
ncbi:MAG: cytochrome-c peroxidase [Myxococcota bacterium]